MKRQQTLSPTEWAKRELGEDYTPINPEHNGLRAILKNLALGECSPSEVENLCQTAKVPGLHGFTRIDQLPCGCTRIYKAMIRGIHQVGDAYRVGIGGIEGVKPCQRHTALVERIKLFEGEK